MPGKIFYRERLRAREGDKKPRYKLVAVSDLNVKVYTYHLRMSELEHIAKELGADLVELRRGPKHQK